MKSVNAFLFVLVFSLTLLAGCATTPSTEDESASTTDNVVVEESVPATDDVSVVETTTEDTVTVKVDETVVEETTAPETTDASAATDGLVTE